VCARTSIWLSALFIKHLYARSSVTRLIQIDVEFHCYHQLSSKHFSYRVGVIRLLEVLIFIPPKDTTDKMALDEEAETSSRSNGTEGGENTEEKKNDDKAEDERAFECNICLDTAKDAVISMCGHLFCWPCLHQWLETRPNRQSCPVCKAAISRDKVIPLYGRGGSKQDPREKLPPRPQGQRTEPENNGAFSNFGFDGGFQMSFGIGAFPFGLFASTFNFGDPVIRGHGAHGTNPANMEDERFLSQLFLWVAILFIFWLLVA